MGWLGKKAAPAARDWSAGPVERGEWASHALPYPDSLALVEQAISRSGADPSTVDKVDGVVRVWNLVITLGSHALQRDPAAQAGLHQVGSRADLTDELLWNYFTHHGAIGIAAQHHVIETYVDSGQIVEVLAQLMADGEMRLDLGGHDRV